ncbi:hypothetical protein O7632_12330 [Solwaraspora sp. WMMD406]|uniref:hypothetical protein n=1 Tax=Solwaraspora sp. WMMD406 TaxID=3016095 RepID=UPI002416C894|nr:hypothetical protein [Solwaraspora sp. WMMD406]MDG4764880.1 hypothetical protein [Solwaraspora sp. WMMD406]
MPQLLPETSATDHLDVIALDGAPRLCALYRTHDAEFATEEDLPDIAGWVLAWPDGSALTLLTEGEQPRIISGSLSNVESWWSALLAADLVAVQQPTSG